MVIPCSWAHFDVPNIQREEHVPVFCAYSGNPCPVQFPGSLVSCRLEASHLAQGEDGCYLGIGGKEDVGILGVGSGRSKYLFQPSGSLAFQLFSRCLTRLLLGLRILNFLVEKNGVFHQTPKKLSFLQRGRCSNQV